MTGRWLSEGATEDDMRVLAEQDAARERERRRKR